MTKQHKWYNEAVAYMEGEMLQCRHPGNHLYYWFDYKGKDFPNFNDPHWVWCIKPDKLISPNAKCRVLGCRTTVSAYGCYPGVPKTHCPRCGKLLSSAGTSDIAFVEPIYPESDFFYRIIETIRRV